MSIICLSALISTNAFGQITGTYTLPGTVNGNTVNNLTQLAAVLNTGTVSGTAIFEFTSGYAGGETYPVTFNQFGGTGNVIIRPAASVSSTLTTAGSPGNNALIDLNGVQHLTIDGRPGGVASTIEWQFQNTAASSLYPAFRFINGTSNDTLEYLSIQESASSSASTILFSTGGNTLDNIQHCNIGPYSAAAFNPILSIGTPGVLNSGITILNNNIYNYGTYSSVPYAGVNISSTGNGSNWNISGNSFYSSLSYLSLYSNQMYGIYFNAGSSSYR